MPATSNERQPTGHLYKSKTDLDNQCWLDEFVDNLIWFWFHWHSRRKSEQVSEWVEACVWVNEKERAKDAERERVKHMAIFDWALQRYLCQSQWQCWWIYARSYAHTHTHTFVCSWNQINIRCVAVESTMATKYSWRLCVCECVRMHVIQTEIMILTHDDPYLIVA